jgi:hypothetical protein
MAKSRASNPRRAELRKASIARSTARKSRVHEEQLAAEKRNEALRRKGEPTPRELWLAAYQKRRQARLDAREAAGLPRMQKRNERGFIIEVIDGHMQLRDPGDWHKRRRVRYENIVHGRISVRD